MRRSPGTPEHVGLRVHAQHRTYPPRHRQCQLASSAAQIDGHVLITQPERIDERIEDSGGVSVPVHVIEVGHLAAETKVHTCHDVIGDLPLESIQLTA